MAQYFQDSKGIRHEFPDDATPEEIDLATRSLSTQPHAPAKQPSFTDKVEQNLGNVFGSLPVIGKQAGEFTRAFAHHVGNLPLGIGQSVVDINVAGRDAIIGKPDQSMSGLVSGKNNDTLQWLSNSVKKYGQDRGAFYQSDVPDSVASYTGATAGEVLPWLVGGGAKALQYVGRAGEIIPVAKGFMKGTSLLGQRIVGGAAQGGVASLFAPNLSDGSKLDQVKMSALIGGGSPIATGLLGVGANGLSSLYNVIKNPAISAGKRLLNEYGGEGILPYLDKAKSYFPNQKRTVAESLAGSEFSAKAAAAQKKLGNRPEFATAEEQMRVGNNAAEVNVFRNLAGTPEEKKAAKDLLDEKAGKWYRENIDQVSEKKRYLNASDLINEAKQKRMSTAERNSLNEARLILNRVSNGKLTPTEAQQQLKSIVVNTKTGKNAIEQAGLAMTEFQVKGRPIFQQINKGYDSASPVSNDLAAFLDKNLSKSGHIDDLGNMSTAKLQNVRKEFNRTISTWAKDPTKTISPQDWRYIKNVNATIDGSIERTVSGYSQAKRNYAQYSQVPNTQKAAQGLLDKSIDNANARLNSSHDAKLSPDLINRFLLNDMRKNYQIPQSARKQTEGVLRSMRETAGTNSALSRNGSDTNLNEITNIMQKYTKPFMTASGGAGAGALYGSFAGGVGTGAGAIIGGATGGTVGILNGRIVNRMAEGAYDNQEASKMIRAYLATLPQKERNAALINNPAWRVAISNSQGQ